MPIRLVPKLEDATEPRFDARHAEALGRSFERLDTLAHRADVRAISSFDRYADLELPEDFDGDEDALAALSAGAPETWHAPEDALPALEALIAAVRDDAAFDDRDAVTASLRALRALLETARSRDVRFHLDVLDGEDA